MHVPGTMFSASGELVTPLANIEPRLPVNETAEPHYTRVPCTLPGTVQRFVSYVRCLESLQLQDMRYTSPSEGEI